MSDTIDACGGAFFETASCNHRAAIALSAQQRGAPLLAPNLELLTARQAYEFLRMHVVAVGAEHVLLRHWSLRRRGSRINRARGQRISDRHEPLGQSDHSQLRQRVPAPRRGTIVLCRRGAIGTN